MTSPPTRAADASASGRRVLVALADGMGGHVSGQIASRIVCDGFVSSFREAEGEDVGPRLAHALTRSNDAVAKAIGTDPALAGMGSTLVAAHLDRAGVRWVSVGDSTLMLYRDGILQRLNADHSHGAILDQQAAAGIISEEIAKGDARRRALHSAMTGHPIPLQDLGLEALPLLPGDWVILASDGLLTLSGNEIATLIHDSAGASPEALVAALIEAVDAQGEPNQDNTTVAALAVLAATGTADDEDDGPAARTPEPATAASVSTRIVARNGEADATSAADATNDAPPPAPSLWKPLLISLMLVSGIVALGSWWLLGGG